MKKLIPFIIAFIFVFNVRAINERHIIDEGDFIKIIEKNASYLYNPGYPILPYKIKNYVFSKNTIIRKISIKVKNVEKIKLNKKIETAPFPIALESGSIYKMNPKYEIYPDNWYNYTIRMGLFNGKLSKFLTIYLFPYRYEKNGFLLHAEFNVDIDYEIKNSKKSGTYDLLIITPSLLYNEAIELADFKENHGIKTKVVKLEKIYSKGLTKKDEPEKIKYFIKDAIEQYGIKYVLLVGDADIFPVRYVKTTIEGIDDVPSDLYYADIYRGDGSFSSWDENGNGIYGERGDKIDFMPDVYIGRLPASNEEEMKILVNKIINFELPPQRATFIGTELYKDTPLSEGEFLKDYVSDNIKMNVTKLYESIGYANRNKISDEINKGTMFVNFAAHGNPNLIGWSTGSWSSDDISLLKNKYKMPVIFAMSCSTNEFDDTDCLGEKFLLYDKGGAIAYAGSSRIAYVYVNESIKSGLSGYLDFAFFKAYYDGCNTTGSIFATAKEDYVMHSFLDIYDYLTLMEYNMLGDPTIYLPPLKNTSHAYVEKNIGNRSVNVYAHAYGYNGIIKLYYREKGYRKWQYYGDSKKPYHWEFIPPKDGWYELCSIANGENFPNIADCYCIFDESPPLLTIKNPEKGGIYLLNEKIASIPINASITIGGLYIEGMAKDNLLKKVEILINGKLKYISSSSHFKWKWDGLSFGIFKIKVNAYDFAENKASYSINIFRII